MSAVGTRSADLVGLSVRFEALADPCAPFDKASTCFEAFVTWRIAVACGAADAVTPLPTLTRLRRTGPETDGFVRIDEAFPAAVADECRSILWTATGCDPDNPADTRYADNKRHELSRA